MEKSIDPTKLEILKMARELTINEYIDRRAQEHNEWLDKSSELWKTQRLALAYPVIPPYPTEKEIVIRAKHLMEFLLSDITSKDEPEDALESDIDFKEEATQSNLRTRVQYEIDRSFEDAGQEDDKHSSKMPRLMKGLQDVKRLLNDRK